MNPSSADREDHHVIVDRRHHDRANHHQPVCHGNVNLAVDPVRRVEDLDVGKVRHLNRLRQQLERCGDHRLRCHDGREHGHDQARPVHAWGNGVEKRIRNRIWVSAEIRRLTRVCEK